MSAPGESALRRIADELERNGARAGMSFVAVPPGVFDAWADRLRDVADAIAIALASADPFTECKETLHTWAYFTTQQIDPYLMRCDRTDQHTEHRNDHTGATWTSSWPDRTKADA